jgi:hypothetical protein
MLPFSDENTELQYYKQVDFIPAKSAARFITLVSIYGDKIPCHIKSFIEYNDDTDIYIITCNRASIEGVDDGWKWKTADYTMIREWWRFNRDKVKLDKLFYMEWDVLANIKITDDMFTDGVRTSTTFQEYKETPPEQSWKDVPWWWGEDGDKLPVELKRAATSSMTCMLWLNADALDKLILPEWSKIWETDIICEMSLPTILRYYNVPLYDWSNTLGFMRCHCIEISPETELDVIDKIKTKQPGIYHPVKGTIEDVFGI